MVCNRASCARAFFCCVLAVGVGRRKDDQGVTDVFEIPDIMDTVGTHGRTLVL